MKDASAIHDMPRIVLRSILSSADLARGRGELQVTVSNPRDVAIQIQFFDISSLVPSELPADLHSKYSSNPPLRIFPVQLRLRGDSPVIGVGAFEDELLIEDDNEVESKQAEILSINDWHVSVDHNVASINVPVDVFVSPEASMTICELSLMLAVTTTSQGSSVATECKLYTKIIVVVSV